MNFTTSADEFVRRKTIGVSFAMFMFFVVLPMLNLSNNSDRWIWCAGFSTVFILLILFTYLRKPTKYEVDHNKIIIHRPIGNVEIVIKDIARVDRIQRDLLMNAAKGGAFGYFGKFNTDLGKITFYATRKDKLVMLTKHDNSKIILTPDQEDRFIEDVENSWLLTGGGR